MGINKTIMRKIKKALISVSDKKDLKKLLKALNKYKINLISSGGTYKEIKKLKYECIEIAKYTGSPEILDGRVKTLHPKIHAGILSKRKSVSHKKDLKKNNFEEIDLVIVNFYPFEKTLEQTNNHSKIIENIDIGGPTMVRAAAKNYNDVTVITSARQYDELINELEKYKGFTSLEFKKKMSLEAFSETAYYDTLISNHLNKINKNAFPIKKTISMSLMEKLRYGENPHQKSAIYSLDKSLELNQIHGKKLSYNNFNDMYSAMGITQTLPKNRGTTIVKHANPCGISTLINQVDSFNCAFSCDPISAFGGVVSCNYEINEKLAKLLHSNFFEVIVAKGFKKKALNILKRKKNLRLVDSSNFINVTPHNHNFVSNINSVLIQSPDTKLFKNTDFKVVSKNKPNIKQFNDLVFAFNVCRNVKSNAIVLAHNYSTIGIGSGQPSRLDSCKIAIEKMKEFKLNNFDNKVAASDAFFPFVDGIETLVQSGITAIIQPYGSIRDKEIIKYANDTNTVLVFSKTRHFKH